MKPITTPKNPSNLFSTSWTTMNEDFATSKTLGAVANETVKTMEMGFWKVRLGS